MERKLPIRKITDAESANAFLIGLIFNQNQKAERAWNAPYLLKERLGTLHSAKILKMSPVRVGTAIQQRPALHPFLIMAKHVYAACELLEEKYGGDARAIWRRQGRGEVLRRLQEFSGIGRHKAIVGVFLLEEECKVFLKEDGTKIDIRMSCPALYSTYRGNK